METMTKERLEAYRSNKTAIAVTTKKYEPKTKEIDDCWGCFGAANGDCAECARNMSREILFRGKRIDNGEWLEGYYVNYGFTGKEKCYIVPSYASDLYSFEVDPSTVCQYTGLTDKNGKKIFENDIVYFEDAENDAEGYHDNVFMNVGEIVYADGQYYITNRETVDMDDLLYGDDKLECEVKGNIFDNPELLEV